MAITKRKEETGRNLADDAATSSLQLDAESQNMESTHL